MAETFEILAGFLEKFGTEVEGRMLADPTATEQDRLRQLARGQLPPAEREAMMMSLNDHPHWVAWLAREVKRLRGTEP